MTQRQPVLTGGCQCGAVRYAIYAMPEGVNICHCRMCQKASGNPYGAFVPNQKADFAWTRGTPAAFRSSSIAERDFCRDCGTPLAYRGPSGRIVVTFGSLDEAGGLKLTNQFGMEGKHAWTGDLAKLAGTESWADKTPAERPNVVNYQHPDHDTPDGWRAKTGGK